MRTISFIIILLALNCNKTSTAKNTYLVGKWMINEFSLLHCNVCPEITFEVTGNGKIKEPTGKEIFFTYTVDTNSKTITFSINDNFYFSDKIYSYNKHIEGNLIVLELNSKSGDSYTFTRQQSK